MNSKQSLTHFLR